MTQLLWLPESSASACLGRGFTRNQMAKEAEILHLQRSNFFFVLRVVIAE